MVRRVLALAVLVFALTHASPAGAHPLGNFTINHLAKVHVTPAGISIRYVLDIAEIPTFQIMRGRGIDGPDRGMQLDRWATDEVAIVQNGLSVAFDGAPIRLAAGVPRATTRPGAGGLPTLYWVEEFHAALPAASAIRKLTVFDLAYPGRIGWKDVVVAPETEPTDELRAYPSALLGSPRSVSGVTLTVGAGGRVLSHVATSDRPASPAGSPAQFRANALSDMLAKGAANPWLVLLTLAMAIGLGALHALEPGHGKTLLAVSLVATRESTRPPAPTVSMTPLTDRGDPSSALG